MGTKIFLGEPPSHIKQWIIDHHGPIVKETTVVKYTSASGLPNWEGDIVGTLTGGSIPNKSNVEVVVIGSHVTSIGNSTFHSCSGLTSVTIPDSVTSIGPNAFYYCTHLINMTIGNNVTSIMDWAFSGCQSLTNMTIPASVTSIRKWTFYDCGNLQEITFEGFTCDYVVSNAMNWGLGIRGDDIKFLVVAYCSDGVVVINDNSGSSSDGGEGATKVTYVDGTKKTFKIKGELTSSSIDNRLNVKEVALGSSVTSIGPNAFFYCSGLTSVTIPDSVTSIGLNAFQGCSGLTSMTIPDSVTSIGSYAFDGCRSLMSVTISNRVTSIWDSTFRDCSGLTSMTIPNSVNNIINFAFEGCSGLTSVTIPDSVTSIGNGAFNNCTSLTNVTIPDSVTSIQYDVFYGCNNLQEITFEGFTCDYVVSNAMNWGLGISSNYTKFLVVAYCSDGVVVINDNSGSSSDGGEGATKVTYIDGTKKTFKIKNVLTSSSIDNRLNAKNVEIGSDVKRIGDFAFEYCDSLMSVTIPDSVTSIGDAAFMSCSGLTNVTIPDSITSIGPNAFSGCSGLTSMTIPNSVMSIGNRAFDGCSGLTSVTIPDGVTSIGESAFNECSRLTSVTFSSKAKATVQGMANYSWSLSSGCIIHCTDGNIVI